jgi:2-(1,2-epoxy-1,2-dihydrophenyl)acetyl-CoA isomerase
MMTDIAPVLVTRHETWHEIVLNRPEKLNAFSPDMQRALMEALEAASADKTCRAVLLTGAGKAFCAGQNLSDRDPRKLDGPPDLHHTVTTYYNPLIRQIRALRVPVVCAVNGAAAGAGVGVALACDLVLASEKAKFILAFSRIGLGPDAGSSWFLARALGELRAKALALTGGALTAQEAHQAGLVVSIHSDEELLEAARAYTAQIAGGATLALGWIKQAIHASGVNSLDAQLDLEAEIQGQAGRTPDYREGVIAFLEKRPARFSGHKEDL